MRHSPPLGACGGKTITYNGLNEVFDYFGRLQQSGPLIDLRAEAVTLMAARPGDSAVRHLTKRTDLLYLGQADGTVVLFDPAARQALHLPADTVLMRLSRPAPRQGRSPFCTFTPPPRWWHGPGWLRARLYRARGVLTSSELLSPDASVDHAFRYSIDSPRATFS